MCDSPFIIKLYETYNSAEHLHFLLEVALGGELYATYHHSNLWGNEACGRFYVAGALLALEHLHGKKMLDRTTVLRHDTCCNLVLRWFSESLWPSPGLFTEI